MSLDTKETPFLAIMLIPVFVVFAAFFILPMAKLVLVAGSGENGMSEYLTVIRTPRHFESLVATVVLSAVTTLAALIISAISGVFLERNRFRGREALISMLTFPLAFPGVVIGFLVIMLAGRQGLVKEISSALTGTRLVFAYSMGGLFIGYLYFSIPRVILTLMAAAEKLDPGSGRSCPLAWRLSLAGHSRCHRARAQAGLDCFRGHLFCHIHGSVRHGLHIGHKHRCAADDDLYRVYPEREHCHRRRLEHRARYRHLGCALHRPLTCRLQCCGCSLMKRSGIFYANLSFTLLVCAFLIVPVFLSIKAGVTENFFQGVKSGLTLRWVGEVWDLYAGTIYLSLLIAIACLIVCLLIGVPAAYVLAKKSGRVARIIEETLVLPVAIPGLAIALALIITYGGFRDFRTSWLSSSLDMSCTHSPSWCARYWRFCRVSISRHWKKEQPVWGQGSGIASSRSYCPIVAQAYLPAH